MTTDKIIAAAREAGFANQYPTGPMLDMLGKLYAIAYRAGMERAAEIAEDYCRTYSQTKEAHERLSMEPFRPGRFGLDLDRLHQSQRIADNIRAEAHAKNQPESTHDTGNV